MKVMELKEQLGRTLQAQQEGGFIVTGFYLAQDDVDLLRPELTPDVPSTGATGRYCGVPVFLSSGVAPNNKEDSMSSICSGRQYSFVKMNVVN